MGVNLKFSCSRFSCVCMHLEMWAEVKVHSYHVHAHVRVGSCMYCAQASPCPSYSGRRDRNNSVHWCSLYEGVCSCLGSSSTTCPATCLLILLVHVVDTAPNLLLDSWPCITGGYHKNMFAFLWCLSRVSPPTVELDNRSIISDFV